MSSSHLPSILSSIINATESFQQSPSEFSIFFFKCPLNDTEILKFQHEVVRHKEFINIIEIQNCPTTLEASKLLSNSVFLEALESLTNLKILKLTVNEKLNDQHAEKPNIYQFKIQRNFLISYESIDASQKIIYWKNAERFLTVKLIDEYSMEMTDFVRDFLIDVVDLKINDPSQSDIIDLTDLHDANNFNLLMKAVDDEQKVALIDELLCLPFDVNQKSRNKQSAADIAWEKRNFEMLLKLLQANSTYPKEFNQDKLEESCALEEMNKFFDTSVLIHRAIRIGNSTKVEEIIRENPNLRYFYNSSNVSAATTAIKSNKIEIYKLLLENECSIGPNEDFNEIINGLSKYESEMKIIKKKLLTTHDNASIELPEKHLMILCANSVISHDNQYARQRLKHIKDAFNNLNEISITKQILQITSIQKNFKIYFDFNRSSVEFINPYTGSQLTRGLCESSQLKSFYLYISAKNLLNNDQKFAGIATLAHELCHFAMNLTFCNYGKPYAIDDEVNENRFNEIINKYEKNQLEILNRRKKIEEYEKLILFCEYIQKSSDDIDLLRKDYEMNISMLVKIICDNKGKVASYEEQIESIQDQNFKLEKHIEKLSDKLKSETEDRWERKKHLRKVEEYREIILSNEKPLKINTEEMEKINEIIKVDEIQLKQHEKEFRLCNLNNQIFIDEYQSDISNLQNEIEELQDKPEYEQIVSSVFDYDEDLWPCELIVRVPHMIVHYQNDPQRLKKMKVIFKELFDYYEGFVVPTMKQTQPILEKLFNNSTEIKFSDLTDAHKAKIHHSIINFQGVKVKFNEIIEDKNSEIFQHLSAAQIRGIFIFNTNLTIGWSEEMSTSFYVERNLIEFSKNTVYKCKLTYNGEFQKDVWDQEYSNDDNFDEILSVANVKKMILLADHGGAGKSTTFKYFSAKLKEKFPNYWMSYVDLKQHLKTYEKFEKNFNANQIFEILCEILEIDDEIDVEIFTKLYHCNKIVLFYDGIDEISPNHNEFILNIIDFVHSSTQNQLWIATRPQYTLQLEKKFNQIAYKFETCGDGIILKFIKNIIQMNRSFNDDEAMKIAEDILKIIYKNINCRSRGYDYIKNPLMLKMISELYLDDKNVIESLNLFSLYQKMLELNNRKLYEKGEIVNDDREKENSSLKISQVHQIYALKLIYKNIDMNELSLFKKWNTREKSKWTPEQISRYGILVVDSWNTAHESPVFVHRTFAEFFIAKFLIDNIYDLDNDEINVVDDKEFNLRMKVLISIAFDENEEYEIPFILGYRKNHSHHYRETSDKVYKYITASDEMNDNVLKIYNDYFGDRYLKKIHNIQRLYERFLIDFRFKDKNETFFQYCFQNKLEYDLYELFNTYKDQFGTEWIKFTGYELRENFSLPDDEIIEGYFAKFFMNKEDNINAEYVFQHKLSWFESQIIMKFAAIFCIIFIVITALVTFSNAEQSTGKPEDQQTCKENLGECMNWCNEKIRKPSTDCKSDEYCCVLV